MSDRRLTLDKSKVFFYVDQRISFIHFVSYFDLENLKYNIPQYKQSFLGLEAFIFLAFLYIKTQRIIKNLDKMVVV